MKEEQSLRGWKDRALFTPGPLTTSPTVKQAALRDLGSRDNEFMQLTQKVRDKLLTIANVSPKHFSTVLMQGCGTFAVESVIVSTTPPDGKLLIATNGCYGNRMITIAEMANIETVVLTYKENKSIQPSEIEEILKKDPTITNIAMTHCETTSGILNPITEVGQLAKKYGVSFFVDAMSTFGAWEFDFDTSHIDYLVASSSKCLEGVPIIGIIIARLSTLEKTKGFARSHSLDLYHQWVDLETKGEFRFTPPIPAILSLNQALDELIEEGGVLARADRYRKNHRLLIEGMRRLGFQTYLPDKKQGYFITSFIYPDDPRFDYQTFYENIREFDLIIYSGKVTNALCFRIGNIGRLFSSDIQHLLWAIESTIDKMQLQLMNREHPNEQKICL